MKASSIKRAPEVNLNLVQRAIAAKGVDAVYRALNKEQQLALKHTWDAWKRVEQTCDLSYAGWMYLAGRGSGKTRAGAEWVYERKKEGYRRGAFVARTAADVRDILVEGEAGILETTPPWDKPIYEPSKRSLYWAEQDNYIQR